jgi:hypothetical protein
MHSKYIVRASLKVKPSLNLKHKKGQINDLSFISFIGFKVNMPWQI